MLTLEKLYYLHIFVEVIILEYKPVGQKVNLGLAFKEFP